MSRRVTIDAWDSADYREVWLITETKEGAISKTKALKKYIHKHDIEALQKVNPTREFHFGSISLNKLKENPCIIELLEIMPL